MRRLLCRGGVERFRPGTAAPEARPLRILHSGIGAGLGSAKGRGHRRVPVAITAAVLAAVASTVCSPSAGATENSSGTTTTLRTCTWSALESAIAKGGTVIFACSGTIAPTTAITVSGTENLTLDAAGESVVLMGHELKNSGGTNTVRLFVVEGGSLTLDHLALEDSQVAPPAGQNGTAGMAGTNAKAATGGDGTSGGPGTSGAAGTVAQGGAVYVARGAHLSVLFSTFEDDGVEGSPGGNDGSGGKGGSGTYSRTSGTAGGNGANGGNAGAGGGANGQSGEGGAVYNAGTLVLIDDSFTMNAAYGGSGGSGGSGGAAGSGGAGTIGAFGTCQTGGNGGDAGPLAGQAGDGGNGGTGEGGAVYNVGTLRIAGGAFSENGAVGAGGGNGGSGGAGGAGGDGADGASGFSGGTNPCGPNGGAIGGIGASGTNGDNGRPAGNGGAGLGGAVYNGGSLQLSGVSFGTNIALGGPGGQGGSGGVGGDAGNGGESYANACTDPDEGCLEHGGNGGNGGSAGDGGNAGLAAGGAVYSTSTFASSRVQYSGNLVKQRAAGKAGQPGQFGDGGASEGINGEAGGAASPGKTPTPEGQNEFGASRSGLSLTTTSLPKGLVGKAYSASLKAKGGTTPYSWAVVSGSLPKGLVLSPSKGTITGKPAAKATITLVLTVTDHSGEVSVASLKLSVT